MQTASRSPLWRRTPPAIFPICLALMALGLGWRGASRHLPVAHEVGDLLLGFGSAFFLCALAFYLAKLAARPAVLLEDMVTAPARAGVAAGAMSMMMLAAALLPFGISVPLVWWTGVILSIGASIVVFHAMWRDGPNKREFTPFQYLTFVGPIVGPIAGIPLGHVTESLALTFGALFASTVITFGLAITLLRARPPAPMRPPLVIFLAPNCLFAIAFGLLGIEWGFHLFYWISSTTALLFLTLIPWLTRGGWSPLWSGFTFPLSAFLNMQVLAIGKGLGLVAVAGTWLGLAVATPVVLIVGYRISMMWITGALADKTGAAVA